MVFDANNKSMIKEALRLLSTRLLLLYCNYNTCIRIEMDDPAQYERKHIWHIQYIYIIRFIRFFSNYIFIFFWQGSLVDATTGKPQR